MKKFVAAIVSLSILATVSLVTLVNAKPYQDPIAASVAVAGEAQNCTDLRVAIAKGGKVKVAPDRYYFLDTVVLKNTTSLEGEYADLTTLDFTRMTDPTKEAIRIDRVWGYEISRITIVGNRRDVIQNGVVTQAANAIGILNSTNTPNANGSYGTCSGSAVWSHVIIAGFKKGLVVGSQTNYIAASENLYLALKIVMCDTCVELNDYNTLNHKFIMPQFGDCFCGIRTNGASYVSVDGGSFSACKGVLFDMVQCSAAKFRDCRMEDSGVFFRGGTTMTEGHSIIDGCQIHQSSTFGSENSSAYANGWKSPIIVGGAHSLKVTSTFVSCTVPGWPAVYSLTNGYVEATGNSCNIDPNGDMFAGTNKTVFVTSLQATPLGRVFTKGNRYTDAGMVPKTPNSWYPDQTYPLAP